MRKVIGKMIIFTDISTKNEELLNKFHLNSGML